VILSSSFGSKENVICTGNCMDCCIRGSQIQHMNKYTPSTFSLSPVRIKARGFWHINIRAEEYSLK
jgi:hypothetical protein